MIELAVWVPAVLLYCYLVLSAIEFGSVAFLFLPRLLGGTLEARTVLNPVWEASNVFLVFALTAFEVSFPQAVPEFSRAISGPVLAAIGFLGARAVFILLAYYADSLRFAVRWGLLLSSVGAPVFFAASFLGLLGWQIQDQSWGLLVALALSGTLLFAGAFFWAFAGVRRLLWFTAGVGFVFLVSLGLFFQGLGRHAEQLFLGNPVMVWLPLIVTAVLITGFALSFAFWRGWLFVSCVVGVGVVFFSLVAGNLPYLLYPEVTAQAAVTDTSTLQIFFVSNLIGAAIIIPALALLYRRVLRSS